MAQYDINLREYWRILKKRKFVVILTAIVLGAFSTAFAILRAPTPLYTSVCSVKFEKQTTVEGLYAKTISWSGGDDIQTQISIIKSHLVFESVAKRLGLVPQRAREKGLKKNMVRIVENLQSRVEVERERLTNILNIKVTDRNPVFAERLANAVATTYKKLHAEEQMRRTTEALKYIDEQLRKVRQKLREAEEEFNRFSQDNQLISIDLQSENLLASAQKIQDEMRKLQEDKRELEGIVQRLKQFIENPLSKGQDFYSTKGSSQYQSTNDTLVGLLLKKDTLLQDYTPQHPAVVAISRKILENARKMLLLLQLEISGMEKKELDFRKELETVDKKTRVLMDKKLEFDRLQRSVQSYHDMTALLEKKNQEALIRKAEKPEEITIVKPALLPSKPINPPKTVTTGAMGVVIGLVLGIVLGFIVETFDTSLGAIEDVEETLGTQVLGIIPHADAKDIRESLKDKQPEGIGESSETQMVYLISHFVPKSMIAESFRALRTNIQFKDTEKKARTIAVASTSPEEGKTQVAINLAITMAQAGMKTLLVGSDLRKPAMDRVFGVEMSPGLTDILVGKYPWHDTVKTVTDIIMGRMSPEEVMMTPGLDNLHIITSGPIPPNPAELIDADRLTAFIGEAKQKYDIIIFDSTPILSTADAAILGTKVDGVLLVYRVGSVSRGLLKRSMTQLQQVNCNIMGVVLNGMRPEVSPDFQDYKYYSYYYSYGEQGKGGRAHKRVFSFKGKKEEGGHGQEILSGEPARAPQAGRGRRLSIARLSMLLMAAALLAAGILWQNGIIDPFKLLEAVRTVKKNERHPVVRKVKKRTARPTVPRKARTPKGNKKRTVSKAKSGPGGRSSVSKKGPVKKPPAVVKRPSVKGNTPMAHPKKTEPKPLKPMEVATLAKPSVKPATRTPAPPNEAKKEAVANKRPPSPKKVVSYPYSLYLGSYRSLERAERAITIYSQKGLSPYWAEVDFSEKGVWYRVFSGHFEDPKRAEGFKKAHQLEEATVKKTAYANLIGVYGPSDKPEQRLQSLRNLGYSPYVIRDHGGRYRIFVGAFITQEGAEKQNHDLKSKGVLSQVVKR